MYATVQATPFLQQFIDEQDIKIRNGCQLNLQLRIGYRFEFFNQRWFLEHSDAFNHWLVYTISRIPFRQSKMVQQNIFCLSRDCILGSGFNMKKTGFKQ